MKEKTMSEIRIFRLLFLGLMILTSTSADGEQIISDSNIRFIDGSTLIINGQKIALYAIKAPAMGTPCGPGKQKYDCGLIARSSLMDMSAGATISCNRTSAPYDKNKFKCLSNGYDLSEGMVYTGWAKPLKSAPPLFKKLAREAKEKHRGIWRIAAQ